MPTLRQAEIDREAEGYYGFYDEDPAPRRSGRHRSASRPRRGLVLAVVVLLGLGGGVVLRRALPLFGSGPRVLLYGDSLVVEALDAFRVTAADGGVRRIRARVWSGTAPCNYLSEVGSVARDFHPSVAVIAFSGNAPACMTGRDLLTAYRADVTAMVQELTSEGVAVVLVEEPPREVDQVDAAGWTVLGRLWQDIAAHQPDTRVLQAGRAVTDSAGRFAWSLPCEPGEQCGADGRVVLRSPDGVHFCPVEEQLTRGCEVYSAGARRYGAALARGVLG
jgi:hypothetical protein